MRFTKCLLLSLTINLSANAGTNFSVDQLRTQAATQSFNTQFEIQSALQARLTSKTAYLNLLPHLSIGSLLSGAQFAGILSIVGAVGDLAPFLLPDRWFQANEDKNLYQAELLTSSTMKLDTTELVEGLALGLVRDQALDAQLQADQAVGQKLQDQVTAYEHLGMLPRGSADSIATAVNNIAQTDSLLQSNIATELDALSQAVGFTDPSAITAVTLSAGEFGDITKPQVLNLSTLEATAQAISPEIKQMGYIYNAAINMKHARAWNWLDPAGDYQGGLGAGLPSYLAIGKSGVDQVTIQTNLVKSTVLKKVADAYNNYMGWAEFYPLTVQGINIQLDRISTYQSILAGNMQGFDAGELRDAIENLAINHANQLNATYAFYAQVSLLNRATLVGPYAQPQNPLP